MTTKQEVALFAAAVEVLVTHGLNATCEARPNWTGTARQRETLATLHEVVCELLPPLPEAPVPDPRLHCVQAGCVGGAHTLACLMVRSRAHERLTPEEAAACPCDMCTPDEASNG